MSQQRIDLLKRVSFGKQVAEDEVDELTSYFVESSQWADIANGKTDIVRGEKGAGKSAIYSLLLKRESTFFDNGILIIPAETLRGATVFKDLVADPPTNEIEFTALWKLYILTIIANELREYGVGGSKANKIYGLLEEAELLEKEFSLRGLLRSAFAYAKRIVAADAFEGGLTLDPTTLAPNGVTTKIVLREPKRDLRDLGYITIDKIIELTSDVLTENKLNVWILLDRLDVAFIETHELEANALRALIRVYADLRGVDNISLKIFLREDIWKRITIAGMREASHLINYVIINWNSPDLLNLIIRRVLNNDAFVAELGVDKQKVLEDSSLQEKLFYRIFPDQIEQGPQKASTFNWLITRCADGTKKTAPRELIHLLNCIKDREIRRLEQGGKIPADGRFFDRSVFKTALPEVSDARLNQYLYAEYPLERQFIQKMEGQKAEQTPETLSKLWDMRPEEAIKKSSRLVDLGFFEERSTSGQPSYWVPFLYRDALKLVQGKAEG